MTAFVFAETNGCAASARHMRSTGIVIECDEWDGDATGEPWNRRLGWNLALPSSRDPFGNPR